MVGKKSPGDLYTGRRAGGFVSRRSMSSEHFNCSQHEPGTLVGDMVYKRPIAQRGGDTGTLIIGDQPCIRPIAQRGGNSGTLIGDQPCTRTIALRGGNTSLSAPTRGQQFVRNFTRPIACLESCRVFR